MLPIGNITLGVHNILVFHNIKLIFCMLLHLAVSHTEINQEVISIINEPSKAAQSHEKSWFRISQVRTLVALRQMF